MKALIASVGLVIASATAAFPQAAAGKDCEAIEEALAYNACLAEQGPRVGERRAAPRTRSSGGIAVERRPGGRKAATFEVITGK